MRGCTMPRLLPADVLILAPLTLRQFFWSKYPLVLSIFGLGYQQRVLRAATQYAQRKRTRADVAARCVAVSLGFEPIVFESLGCLEQGSRDLGFRV